MKPLSSFAWTKQATVLSFIALQAGLTLQVTQHNVAQLQDFVPKESTAQPQTVERPIATQLAPVELRPDLTTSEFVPTSEFDSVYTKEPCFALDATGMKQKVPCETNREQKPEVPIQEATPIVDAVRRLLYVLAQELEGSGSKEQARQIRIMLQELSIESNNMQHSAAPETAEKELNPVLKPDIEPSVEPVFETESPEVIQGLKDVAQPQSTKYESLERMLQQADEFIRAATKRNIFLQKDALIALNKAHNAFFSARQFCTSDLSTVADAQKCPLILEEASRQMNMFQETVLKDAKVNPDLQKFMAEEF